MSYRTAEVTKLPRRLQLSAEAVAFETGMNQELRRGRCALRGPWADARP
jgi:hypothetical protein